MFNTRIQLGNISNENFVNQLEMMTCLNEYRFIFSRVLMSFMIKHFAQM